MQLLFDHRSGRVVAALRLALVCAIGLALWFYPWGTAADVLRRTGLVLGAYGLVALAVLQLTWNNWWLDHRLAWPVHVLDVAFFTVLALITERHVATPFFLLFVFLLLSAFKRFGWQPALYTVAAALILYVCAGLLGDRTGMAAQAWNTLVLRRYYLLLLTLTILWFAINQNELLVRGRIAPFDPARQAPGTTGRAALLAHARHSLRAGTAMLLWSDPDEPWTVLERLDVSGEGSTRFAPDALDPPVDPELAGRPFLMAARQPRQLLLLPDGLVVSRRLATPVAPALLPHLAGEDALVVPVPADDGEVLLILTGVQGLCSDDLPRAAALAEDLAQALNRLSLLDATARLAVGNARVALARDIHDSVLQLLAGAGFRMAALRQLLGAAASEPAVRLLDDLTDQLVRAQADVRDHVSQLRGAGGTEDAGAALASLVQRLERQWGVACTASMPGEPLELPAPVVGELRQLVREMVANAARHGRATHISIAMSRAGRHVTLTCRDDGIGMAAAGAPEGTLPWSISERVAMMGGTLQVTSSAAGTIIAVEFAVQD